MAARAMAPATDQPRSAVHPGTSETDNKPHRRPRHQIKRSLTELAAPVRLQRQEQDYRDRDRGQQQQQQTKGPDERRHLTRRSHDHHSDGQQRHQHRSRKDRHDGGGGSSSRFALANQFHLPVPNSAGGSHNFFGRASADMPRSERSSSYFGSDLDRSRRTSLVNGSVASPGPGHLLKISAGGVAGDRQKQASRELTAAEREALLRKERADAISRADALRSSLAELNAFSNDATKTLDDSYYSVLERLGALQQTIVALRELASLSSGLAQSFKHDSADLVEEIDAQIQPFGELDEHQDRIASLRARIGVGRDKTKGLTERVDRVRERVESWEAADQEWRARTRKRIKVVWAVLVTAVITMVLLVTLGAYHDKLISAETTAAAVEKASALSSGISSAGHSVYSSNLPRPTMLKPRKTSSEGAGKKAGADHDGDAVERDRSKRLVDEVREALRAGHQDADRRDADVLRVLDEL